MRELRLLLTSSCNYNCFFCHHEGMQVQGQRPIFDASDYVYLYKAFKQLYLSDEITATGGEPLVRSDIYEILKALKEVGAKTTLVTNGSLLEKFYQVGKYVDRINISLHSLDPDIYSSMVGASPDALSRVIAGIHKVVSKYPQAHIRFNTTVLKGVNNDKESIGSVLDFAQGINASVKFIELYPTSSVGFIPLEDVEAILKIHRFEKIKENARQSIYSRDGAMTAVVTRIFCAHAARSENPNEYCRQNQDLFITPAGGIKTCMNTSEEINVFEAVKEQNLKKLSCQFIQAINQMGKHCKQRED